MDDPLQICAVAGGLNQELKSHQILYVNVYLNVYDHESCDEDECFVDTNGQILQMPK